MKRIILAIVSILNLASASQVSAGGAVPLGPYGYCAGGNITIGLENTTYGGNWGRLHIYQTKNGIRKRIGMVPYVRMESYFPGATKPSVLQFAGQDAHLDVYLPGKTAHSFDAKLLAVLPSGVNVNQTVTCALNSIP